MRLGLLLVLIPGMQVRELVDGRHQKSVRVKIEIYRDTMPLARMRRAVIAKFAVTVPRNFELAFKVVDPAANKRGSLRRKIR